MWVQGTVLRQCRFMRNAVSAGHMWSGISSQSITIPPIYECGRQLVDMVYLKMDLQEEEMRIEKIDYKFSVCRVENYSQTNLESAYCFIGKTDEECSLVCITDDIPGNVTDHDDGWKAFRIQGTLDFSLVGILAKISALLAENGIGIFAVSTYNTDYILTKKENFDKAMEVLKHAGYEIS